MIKVELKGAEALLQKLGPQQYQRVVSSGLQAAALHVKGRLAKYPKSPGGRPQFPNGFKSDKQRKFFFAALKDGRIDVPYRRGISPASERLGQSWAIQSKGWHTVIVGNDTSYAPFVQQKGKQAGYHRTTGWKTDEQVAKEEGKKVQAILDSHIGAWLNG